MITGNGMDYDAMRERNIAANRALLMSLKLTGPGVVPMIPKPRVAASPKKTPKKARPSLALAEPEGGDESGRRRSGRLLGLHAVPEVLPSDDDSSQADGDGDYAGTESPTLSKKRRAPRASVGSANAAAAATKRRRQSMPTAKGVQRSVKGLTFTGRPDTKIFGQQVGTEVGDWWDMRMDCSQAGVHAPVVAGIAGNPEEGCWSIALSGGYEDDVDMGYAFTYTGSGGRALKGTPGAPKNLRTAPQTFDQEWTAGNAALRRSSETQKPVRVIRGFKNTSCFGPETGYRYDGLYTVERAWLEKGAAGFQVCRFALVRLPDQPKIPVQEGREGEADDIYRDFGFDVSGLAEAVVQSKPWTRKLAKERMATAAAATASSGPTTVGPVDDEPTSSDEVTVTDDSGDKGDEGDDKAVA